MSSLMLGSSPCPNLLLNACSDRLYGSKPFIKIHVSSQNQHHKAPPQHTPRAAEGSMWHRTRDTCLYKLRSTCNICNTVYWDAEIETML